MDKILLWLKIVVACIPAAIVGLLFDDVFEALFYHAIPVALALIVFGVAFIVVERVNKTKQAKVKELDAGSKFKNPLASKLASDFLTFWPWYHIVLHSNHFARAKRNHDSAKCNTIPTKYLKIMLFNIIHQKLNHKNRNQKGNQHSNN